MFIRPLRDIFPKCKIFQFVSKFRRELAILVWIFGIAHTLGFIKINNYENIYAFFFDEYNRKYKFYKFRWMLALLVSLPLLFTSNGFFTHILWKYWKILQRLSYSMFLFVVIHMFLIKWDIWPLLAFWLWLWAYIYAYKKTKNTLIDFSTGPKWYCIPCWYIYDENIWDPDSGILPGTKFEDIPDNWVCPVCGVWKSDFILLEWEIETFESEIVSIKYLNENVIELQVDTKKDLSYISGQFMTFAFCDNLWKFNRSYSIANKNGNIFTFLIKLKPNGRAGMLFPHIKVWDILLYTWISGNFQLQNTQNPKVFIATWTGLSPIYSMLLHTPDDINKKLYFWVATFWDLFYTNELTHIPNLHIKTCLSKEQVEFCHFWRIDVSEEDFENHTEFYICGNPGVVESTKKVLSEKWFIHIYTEEFA